MILNIILCVYISIILTRFFVAFIYYKNETKKENNIEKEQKLKLDEITIFQPILSGDKNLKDKLSSIYNNIDECNLIWAIDDEDIEADRIIKEIVGINPKINLNVVKIEKSPFSENPKVYKIIKTKHLWKTYTVILDDDTFIDIQKLKTINKNDLENGVITGIPFYKNPCNIFEKMVVAYVNSNAIYNYFTSAFFNKNNTINGMFYIFKSDKVISLNMFENIKNKLCDDYEFAKVAKKNGFKLYQSIIPCKLSTEIKSIMGLLRLMRRWHVFVNHYIKENFNLNVLIFSIIPFMSSLLLIIFASYNIRLLFIFLLFILINSILNNLFKRIVFKEKFELSSIFYEILSTFIQIIYWGISLINPSIIIWRGKKIKIKNGEIEIK